MPHLGDSLGGYNAVEGGSTRVVPRVTDELASAFLGQAGPDGHQGPRGWSLSCSPHSPGPPLPPLPTSQRSAPSPPITRPEGIHHGEVCNPGLIPLLPSTCQQVTQ